MKQTSKKPGALPAYIQISEVVARRINAGQILVGERLPSERVMAVEFGVAVGTLRKALCELQSQGFLIRKHGSGNYIKKGAELASVYSFFRVELIAGGGLPTAELLSLDKVRFSTKCTQLRRYFMT